MASEIKHEVFRFVALRPPVLADEEEPLERVIRDDRPLRETFVGEVIGELGEAPSHARLMTVLQRRAEAASLSLSLPDDADGRRVREVSRIVHDAVASRTVEGLIEAIEGALGDDIASFTGGEAFARLRASIWDRLEAHYLLARLSPQSLEPLVDGIRTVRVLEVLAASGAFESVADLRRVATQTVVLPQTDLLVETPAKEPTPRQDALTKRDEEKAQGYRELWGELVGLHSAVDAVRAAPFERVTEETVPGDMPEDARTSRPSTEDGSRGRLPGSPAVTTVAAKLSREVLAGLPRVAGQALESVRLDDSLSDKPNILDALQSRMASVFDQIVSTADPLLLEAMPREAEALPGMGLLKQRYAAQPAISVADAIELILFPWVLRPIIRPLGIGDLKVVKETLQRYVAGEVAHIENVLDGERRERTHRRLDRTEETFTIERESIEETERDNQTTDRFELKKETEKTIQTDMSVDAGVTVSASYGPVELGAYANFAYSQSTTEATRNSQNYARDVVDRSLTKIQKRTREERVTKILKEIEETNVHAIDNSPAGNGHVRGLYRWVDKEYEAQVYNYGRRMMFEFVVPEPAAYYFYSQENDPANVIEIEKPRALSLLTHKDVQPWNFGSYVRAYNVQGVTPPPPEWKVLTHTFDQNGLADDATTSKSSKELIVPDGYVAKTWGYTAWYWKGSDFFLKILVGLRVTGGGSVNLDSEDTVVPVSMVAFDVRAIAANVEVFCQRTSRAFESWQIATFEKIVAAYEAAKTAYENKLKAAEVARGIIIEGRNPGINRGIIRNELKKQCLTLFTGEDYSSFNSVSGLPPVIDLNEAAEEAKFIQFFEQAFEWEQLTYLFYPYFWSRPSSWNKRMAFNDPDPHFNQFLQSGAARVVVPVHPAYNDAILHFVETGVLWNGGTPPHLDDPLFISIVEELKDQTDDLDGAIAEGDPWKVTVPTTLIYLQQDATLPDFTV